MGKQEFIKLMNSKREMWKATEGVDIKFQYLISMCYDVLYAGEELAGISEALAMTKQELEEAKQELVVLETYKSGYNRLYPENEKYKKEIAAYRNIIKSQNTLIELKEA